MFGDGPAAERSLQALADAGEPIDVARCRAARAALCRRALRDGTTYLLRPDQHARALARPERGGRRARLARRRALGQFAAQEALA